MPAILGLLRHKKKSTMIDDIYLAHLNSRVNHWYEQQQRERDNPDNKRYIEATIKLTDARHEVSAYIKRQTK
mgnify:CR=1 FL=1